MRHSERLWHLAHDYGMGQSFMAMWVRGIGIEETADRLYGKFDAAWIDTENVGEIAERLRLDPDPELSAISILHSSGPTTRRTPSETGSRLRALA